MSYRNRVNKNLRSSKQNKSTVRVRSGRGANDGKPLGRTDLNDYAGLNSNNFIKNTNANDYDGVAVSPKFRYSAGPREKTAAGPRQNQLHKFATYNTIFTLSGIKEREIQDRSFLKSPVHDVIARTGGISDPNISSTEVEDTGGEDPEYDATTIQRQKAFDEDYTDSISILSRAHDIFFENINMLSTVGPNSERNLANFTKMEFQIHEPYSITFIEKVRATTAINGYDDYQDAPLLLTIEFKGFDENGKTMPSEGLIRKIPILIARVDFDVNEGGARYSIVAVPYTDLAFDDRFKFPRCTIDSSGNDALQVMKGVAIKLRDAARKERDEHKVRELIDDYQFEIDDEVMNVGGSYSAKTNYKKKEKSIYNSKDGLDKKEKARVADDDQIGDSIESDLAPGGEGRGKKIKIDTGGGKAETVASIAKYFEDAVREMYGFQRLVNDFWTSYLEDTGLIERGQKLTQTELEATVRDEKFKQALLENQYVPWFKIKTTVRTHIKEFDNITKMHRKTIVMRAIPYKVHICKLITPGIALKNVDFSKVARKVYNYIYTGENVDVQNIRINYKSAYYMRNVYDAKANTGIFSVFTDIYQRVFGTGTYPEPTRQLRSYPSNQKGRSLLETVSGEGRKAQEFYDYLTNPEADMIRIEMDILGDPAYLCQDQYVPLDKNNNHYVGPNNDYDENLDCFNSDQVQPLIVVNYRLPDEIDEKDGLMFSNKDKYRDENLFFNGAYQVVKVESRFENGQFLQTLTCVRLNNQSGVGDAVLQNSAKKDSPFKRKDQTQRLLELEKEKQNLLKEERARKRSLFGLGEYD